VQLYVGSPVELYDTSAWVYWPAESTDGADVQQIINGANVSSWFQASY